MEKEPSIRQEIQKYKGLVCSADMVVITLVCSDSRVSLPEGLVDIKMKDGTTKKVVFIGVPTIGGGIPSHSRFRGVKDVLLSWGVAAEKLRVLATQHGDTKEITSAAKAGSTEHAHDVSCGLRSFMEKYREDLIDIHNIIVPWSTEYKIKNRNNKLAPDRLELDVIRSECPDGMDLIDALHKKTGLPRRLILRAAYRNMSSAIADNEMAVADRVGQYVLSEEHEDLWGTCFIGAAEYDHQKKILIFNQNHSDLGFADREVPLPELTPRTDTIQNPNYVVISFGKEAICIHNGVVLPEFARTTENPDNIFRACASTTAIPNLLCAFAEAFYAVVHKVEPHPGDNNFSTLQQVVVVCDSDEHYEVLLQTLDSPEFKEEYLPIFKQLNAGKILVQKLHLDRPDIQPEMSELQLA